MAKIEVKEVNQQTFRVVIYANSITEHEVHVNPSYAQSLGYGNTSTVELIEKSFEFLLNRESNNSILKRFDLNVISHYFPEYERVICK